MRVLLHRANQEAEMKRDKRPYDRRKSDRVYLWVIMLTMAGSFTLGMVAEYYKLCEALAR